MIQMVKMENLLMTIFAGNFQYCLVMLYKGRNVLHHGRHFVIELSYISNTHLGS